MTATVLQPGEGAIPGQHYLPSRVDEVHWGWLPNRESAPVAAVESGDTITIDTVSHEGLLEDQGRNPVAYLRQFTADPVLHDAVQIADSDIPHGHDDGPHIVTGPVRISGARRGDILRIDVLDLARRVPYGFVSMRHGYGALAGEMPEDLASTATRDSDSIVSMGTVSHFSWVEESSNGAIGRIGAGAGRTVRFPLNPFLGVMGVSCDTSAPVPSVPPGVHGGNIDVKHVTAGTTLYLPVQTEGAGFYVGDPHFAQGNGEVALTALEASLRATLRLSVIPASEVRGLIGDLSNPVVETPTHWIPTGMDVDLDEAMRFAVRNALTFLNTRFGVPRSVALAYLSAAGDFEVSQVVDSVKGVHCMIRKADFAAWI